MTHYFYLCGLGAWVNTGLLLLGLLIFVIGFITKNHKLKFVLGSFVILTLLMTYLNKKIGDEKAQEAVSAAMPENRELLLTQASAENQLCTTQQLQFTSFPLLLLTIGVFVYSARSKNKF